MSPSSHSRRIRDSGLAVLATVAVISGGALGYRQVTGGGGGSETANIWVDTNGGTCARNSTPAVYSDAAACGPSWDNALAIASGGDTIKVKCSPGSSYGDQSITSTRASSTHVTISPASGDGGCQVGTKTGNGPTSVDGDHGIDVHGTNHLTLQGFSNIHGELEFTNCATDILADGESTSGFGSFYIAGTTDLTITNSNFGGTNRYFPEVWPGPGGCPQNNNLIFGPGNTVHDIFSDDLGGFHVDGILIINLNGGTFKGNTFYNNLIDDIAMGSCCGGTITSTCITIENNFLGQTNTNSIQFQSNKTSWDCVNVRNNSALDQFQNITCSPCTTATMKFSGNVIPLPSTASCSSVTYNHNVWIGSGTASCGGTGDIHSSAFAYVNSGSIPPNLHIPGGSSAIDAGDAANCPSIDYDGQSRPMGSVCDAGADEAG